MANAIDVRFWPIADIHSVSNSENTPEVRSTLITQRESLLSAGSGIVFSGRNGASFTSLRSDIPLAEIYSPQASSARIE